MVKWCVVSFVCACLLVGFASRSDAQAVSQSDKPLTPAERSEAQAAFEHGLQLSGKERWLEARSEFLRSVALAPRASTYFNLALVSLELGMGRATLDALEAFEKLSDPTLHASYLTQSAQLRERAKSIVGTLVLSLDPASSEVSVDGVSQPAGDTERVLLLDPGMHTLRVGAQGHKAQNLDVNIVAQSSVHQHVALKSALAVVAPPPSAAMSKTVPRSEARTASRPAQDDTGFFEEPWVWVITGALVVGAGVTVAMLASNTDPKQAAPYTGTSMQVLDPSK